MYIHCPPAVLPDLVSQTGPDGKRYYTTPSGAILPSVTTVVGAMGKASIMEWRKAVGEEEANRVSRFASGRGTRVHGLAEKYLKDEPIDWSRQMPDALAMFRSMIPLMQRINNIHYIEQALWSEKIGMAGRVDLIAEWDGVLSVIDFKTSKKIKTKEDIFDYFAQCTAYAVMFEERTGIPVDRLVIIMAVDDEQPLLFVEKRDTWIKSFIELREDYSKMYNK